MDPDLSFDMITVTSYTYGKLANDFKTETINKEKKTKETDSWIIEPTLRLT